MAKPEGGCEAAWDSIVTGVNIVVGGELRSQVEVSADCGRCGLRLPEKDRIVIASSPEATFLKGQELALQFLAQCPKWQELHPGVTPPKWWFYYKSTIYAKVS